MIILRKVDSQVKDTRFRRVISSALALALCCSCGIGAFASDNNDSSDTTDSAAKVTGTDSLRQTSYTNYVDKYADEARPDKEVQVMGKDYDPGSVEGAEISVTTVDGKSDVMQWANQEGSVSYKVQVPETGVYNIRMSYEALESNTNDVEFALLIDGETPYSTAGRITLPKRWMNETEIKQDSRQNDIRPGQVSVPCWQEIAFEDIDGLYNEPLEFYLEKGEHTFTFESEKAEFAIEYFTLYQYKLPDAYVAPTSDQLSLASGQLIKLEGETAAYKSARTLYPTSDKSSYITCCENGSSPTKS